MRKAAFLCGVTLLFATSLPVLAQQPFEDVPRDHWAYQAVQRLQERGVVIGYPDGTFGGKRAMTRYEFAVAVDRLITDIIDRIQPGGPAGPGGITQQQLNEALQNYVRKDELPDFDEFARKDEIPDTSDFVRRGDIANFITREDLQNIQRLVEEFRDELAAMGTDIQNLRRDLDALKQRVSALEDKVNRFRISGEATAIARGDRFGRINASEATGFPGTQGLRLGTDLDSRTDLNNTGSSILENVRFLYDLQLGITGQPIKGVTANALFNYGNYLPWVATNRVPPGYPAGAAIGGGPVNFGNFGSDGTNGNAQITPLKLNIEGSIGNLGPLKEMTGTLGKFGHQFTPYTLKLVDPDSYTYLSYTDNGEIIMTGARVNAHVGKLMLTGYAAKHESLTGVLGNLGEEGYGYGIGTTWGGPQNLSPIGGVGLVTWDQSAGGRATYDFGRFQLGVTYVEGGVNRTFSNAGTVNIPGNPAVTNASMSARRGWVLGGDLGIDITRRLKFEGEFASSNVLGNFTDASGVVRDREGIFPIDRRNAWDGKLSFGLGRLSLAAGYKQVDPFFGAPGFWGAIGRWKNPTNIRGVNGAIGYNFGEKLSLQGQAEFYNSLLVDAGGPGANTGVFTDDRSNGVQHFQVGVKYNLTSANRVDLGWEQARYHPVNTGVSIENYYNIGFGHDFNDNTSLKLLYQILDYNSAGGPTASALGTPGYRGSIAVGQFSVRF